MKNLMFDPFNDFEINGYLRNINKDKDLLRIKYNEHTVFKININKAIHFLSSRKNITYKDYLKVHQIVLF